GLPGGLPAAEARPAAAPRPAPAPPPQRRAPEPAPRPAPPSPAPAPRAEAAPRPEPGPPRPVPAPSRPSDPITAFKEEAARRKPNLGGFLDAAEDLRYEEDRASILCPQGDSYLKGRLEANRTILEEAAAAVWGAGTRVDILESRSASKPAATEAKPAPVQQVEQIPTVQAVLDIFQGRIETVEEHGSYTED
ncbi:MAG TPA: hypothetical protein VIJ61_05795, partial [Thermoanaerobaculia bacterium]